MPLTGMKVIEVCSNLAGPVTGTIFGDLGADVIKVEKSNGGDDARGWAPLWNDHSAPFQAINRNNAPWRLTSASPRTLPSLKASSWMPTCSSITCVQAPPKRWALRPRNASAQSSACLLRDRGVRRAGAVARPQRLRRARPGAVRSDERQWFPGFRTASGSRGIGRQGCGMWAAIAALGALVRRARTGEGAIVGTSLLEASLFWRDIGFAHYQATGRLRCRRAIRRQHRSLWRVPDRRRAGHARLRRRRPVRCPGLRAGSP